MPPSFITCPSFSYYKLIWFLLFSPVSIWNIYTILALFLSLSHTHICIKQAKQNDDKPVKPNLPFAHNLMARSVIRKVSWLGTRCKISSVTRIPASKHKDIQTSGIRKDPLKAQTRENWNLLRNGKTVCNLSALSSWLSVITLILPKQTMLDSGIIWGVFNTFPIGYHSPQLNVFTLKWQNEWYIIFQVSSWLSVTTLISVCKMVLIWGDSSTPSFPSTISHLLQTYFPTQQI